MVSHGSQNESSRSVNPNDSYEFFNEYKSKVFRKVKMQQQQKDVPGSWPTKYLLTPLQKRLYDIINRETEILWKSSAKIQETESNSQEQEEKQNEDISSMEPEDMQTNVSLPYQTDTQVEISFLDEGEIQDDTRLSTPEPTRVVKNTGTSRKKRKYMRGTPNSDDREKSALELAQDRLESIEKNNAEATLELARANRQLANSILTFGEMLSQSVLKMTETIEQVFSTTPTIKRQRSSSDTD